jgi:hypothetical protein
MIMHVVILLEGCPRIERHDIWNCLTELLTVALQKGIAIDKAFLA